VRKIIVDLSIMVVIGVLLALVGPFGTFEAPLALRLVSWIGFSVVGYAIYSPMSPLVYHFHRVLDLPIAGLWIVACLIATIPMTVLVWVMGFVPGPVQMPTLEQGLEHYAYVLVIGGAVTALFHILEKRQSRSPAPAAAKEGGQIADPAQQVSANNKAEEPGPRFLDRLPPELGSQLLALEMEDHYVRAHTALGSDLVLMRMRDAVAELDGIEGLQVHRSWWVARGAVEDVSREGRNVRLVLSGGLEAPVSRANVQLLKDAGWI